MPTFKCRNLGTKCRFEVKADTREQVMQIDMEHAEEQVTELPSSEMKKKTGDNTTR